MISRKGFVLGIILIVLVLVAGYIFSYQNQLRSHIDQMHRVSVSEVTSQLAVNGASYLGEMFARSNADGRAFLCNEAAPLFAVETPPSAWKVSPGTCDEDGNPSDAQRYLDRLAGDFQKCLNTYSYKYSDRLGIYGGKEARNPRLMSMGIAFESVERLRPMERNLPEDWQAGWDAGEKTGEAAFACTVYFRGLSRTAKVRRQFKLVSMIPGPYCRFTLFTQYSPHPFVYNIVRTRFDGGFDDRSVIGRTGFSDPSPRPLVLYNDVEAADPTNPPSPSRSYTETQLCSRGWVYLGAGKGLTGRRARPETLDGAVFLKIPSGFRPDDRPEDSRNPFATSPGRSACGAGIYLGSFFIRPGFNKRVACTYDLPAEPAGFLSSGFIIKSRLQGFFTQEGDDPLNVGAANYPQWKNTLTGGSLTVQDCLTSWILPYGDVAFPSPTLMFGQVMAEFLQFFLLIDRRTGGTNPPWGMLVPTPENQYNPSSPVSCVPPDRVVNPPENSAFFAPDAGDPGGKSGYRNCARLGPRVLMGKTAVPYNMLFDLMQWSHGDLPDFEPGQSSLHAPWGIGKIPGGSPAIPGDNTQKTLNQLSMPHFFAKSAVHGIQPLSDVHLWRYQPRGEYPADNDEKTLFFGDLRKLFFSCTESGDGGGFNEIVTRGLLSRVTHVVDMRGFPPDRQVQALSREIFSREKGGDSWILSKPGIYLLRRLPGDGDTEIRFPIELKSSAIFIVEHGNLKICEKVVSRSAENGAYDPLPSRNLCSFIALDGDILLPPNREIHAYVAALGFKPDLPGGRLLSTRKSSSNGLFIIGGAAVFETAPTSESGDENTMSHFPQGGYIRYNPYFNPSAPSAPDAYSLIFEDHNNKIDIQGAE